MLADLIQDLRSLHIHVTEQEMDEFVSNNNENSHEWIDSVMEVVYNLMNNSKDIQNTNESGRNKAQINDDDHQVTFAGFDALHEQIHVLRDQLLSNKFQEKVVEKYDMIMTSFSFFKTNYRL